MSSVADGNIAFDNEFNAIDDALRSYTILTGLSVTEQDTPTMGVKVATGDCVFGETEINKVSTTNVALAAAGSKPRKDIIVIDNTGTTSGLRSRLEDLLERLTSAVEK